MPRLNHRRLLVIAAVLLISGVIYAAVWAAPTVLRNKCVGCGDCSKVCPTGAITIIREKAVIDAETCIKCDLCVRTCTYNAIQGKARKF